MKKEKKMIKSNGDNFRYFVYYPEEINDDMPLILFLHGIGERGNNLDDVEKYALPKYLNEFDIPYIVIAPQCSNGNFWDYHLRDVEKVIDEEYKKHKFDKENIFVLGSSMGAYGAWNYIIQRPNLFRGIVSASGGIMLNIDQNLTIIKDKPILIYHGDKDDVVDVSESINAYNKLIDIGASNIELKIIKGENHYLSSQAFKDKYVYEWIDKNLKKNKKNTQYS